eukprot:jgi/Ulvmu1/6581/UM003_0218.1
MTAQTYFATHISGGYESSAVHEAFDGLPTDMLELPVQWSQARDVDWNSVLHGHSYASAYPMFYGLTRKASLAELCQRVTAQDPSCCSAFVSSIPRTLIITDQASLDTAVSALNNSRAMWILKLSECNRGRGLHTLTPGQGQRLVSLCEAGGPWVLQEYVPDLLLLNGHKCHLRAHVLATGALQVWLSSHCLVLPAVKPFDQNSDDDPLVHATNHALWKINQPRIAQPSHPHDPVPPQAVYGPGAEHSSRSCEPQPMLQDEQNSTTARRQTAAVDTGAVTLREACMAWLSDNGEIEALLRDCEASGGLSWGAQHRQSECCSERTGPDTHKDAYTTSNYTRRRHHNAVALERQLLRGIEAVVKDVFAAATARPLDLFPLHNCCQLFGFDFLLDRRLKPHLLEVNADPSLCIFGARLRRTCIAMMHDVAALTARSARSFVASVATSVATCPCEPLSSPNIDQHYSDAPAGQHTLAKHHIVAKCSQEEGAGFDASSSSAGCAGPLQDTSSEPDVHGSFQKVYERRDLGLWQQRARKARTVLRAGGLMAHLMASGAHSPGTTNSGKALGASGEAPRRLEQTRVTLPGMALLASNPGDTSGGSPGCEGWGVLAVQPGIPGSQELLSWAGKLGVRVAEHVLDPYATFVLAERQDVPWDRVLCGRLTAGCLLLGAAVQGSCGSMCRLHAAACAAAGAATPSGRPLASCDSSKGCAMYSNCEPAPAENLMPAESDSQHTRSNCSGCGIDGMHVPCGIDGMHVPCGSRPNAEAGTPSVDAATACGGGGSDRPGCTRAGEQEMHRGRSSADRAAGVAMGATRLCMRGSGPSCYPRVCGTLTGCIAPCVMLRPRHLVPGSLERQAVAAFLAVSPAWRISAVPASCRSSPAAAFRALFAAPLASSEALACASAALTASAERGEDSVLLLASAGGHGHEPGLCGPDEAGEGASAPAAALLHVPCVILATRGACSTGVVALSLQGWISGPADGGAVCSTDRPPGLDPACPPDARRDLSGDRGCRMGHRCREEAERVASIGTPVADGLCQGLAHALACARTDKSLLLLPGSCEAFLATFEAPPASFSMARGTSGGGRTDDVMSTGHKLVHLWPQVKLVCPRCTEVCVTEHPQDGALDLQTCGQSPGRHHGLVSLRTPCMCKTVRWAQEQLAEALGEVTLGTGGIARAPSPAAELSTSGSAEEITQSLWRLGWAAARIVE